MAKKGQPLTKQQLLNEIESTIQSLNLLQAALKGDRSRKPEMLEEYQKKFSELLAKKASS